MKNDRGPAGSDIGRTDEVLADAFEACRETDGWRAVNEVLRIGVRDNDSEIKDRFCGSRAISWKATPQFGQNFGFVTLWRYTRHEGQRQFTSEKTTRTGA